MREACQKPGLVVVVRVDRGEQGEHDLTEQLFELGVVDALDPVDLALDRRELAAVQARRAEIRGTVSGATDVRIAIETLQRRLSALEPIEASATRWSAVFTEVAAHLPRDAYVVRVRGAADSLTIEGLASRAAGVFERLDRAPGIASIEPAASIRHEMSDAGVTVERFSIAARLARDSVAAPASPRRPGGR